MLVWSLYENMVETPPEEEGIGMEPSGEDNGAEWMALRVRSSERGTSIKVKPTREAGSVYVFR